MSEHALPLGNYESEDAAAPSTPKGGKDRVRWVVIERTMGLLPARIMADRLLSEGIPARAWQEAAGQALGLTTGILGAGNVAVHAEFEKQARAILDEAAKQPIEWEDSDDDLLE